MESNSLNGNHQEMTVTCHSTGQEEKINVYMSPHKQYDPDYESDTIKFNR